MEELTQALQKAIDNNTAGTNPIDYADIDFDRDGVNDAYRTLSVAVNYDTDGDGVAEAITVGGVDLDGDNVADITDNWLNGLGGEADLVDLLEPNESTVLNNIAYSTDYSVTLKDDGKLLYRFGTAVKRPNDIRMDVKLALPEEWTADDDNNGIADSLESGQPGFTVTEAKLVITHDITNNPNDQVRPEDYENESAIGRLPSYYIVRDPADASNTLWVAVRDSYNGAGEFLPSYLKLTPSGEVDMAATGTQVLDPNGVMVGYRNTDSTGAEIGTVFKDESLVTATDAAGLTFESEDMAEGFTAEWYTTIDREPFEWSYDMFPDDPNKQVFESFRSPDEAEAAGYTEDSLVSGPRWRLTPNKFGQDLPGLEVPLTENSQPPFQHDNIKYETGELTTTTLNLLDWEGDSPLSNSLGWMTVDHERLDENSDGKIDEGWSSVKDITGAVWNAGDDLPTDLILEAVSPNGMNLTPDFLDTAVYVKGDRQDSAKLYDIQLEIEYENGVIGTVQKVSGLSNVEQTITYQQNTMFSSAVVFATPPTMVGGQTASVTLTDVTSSGASMFVEEPNYLDGWHVAEEVCMVTFAEGNWTLADGTRVEVGKVEVPGGPTDTFQSVTFDQAFAEAPTILVQLQTNNGSDWTVVRTDNVTTTGFDFLLEEQESGDGQHVHTEILGWAAIDADAASGVIDWGGLTSQAFDIDRAVNHDGFDFTFDGAVGTDPLVAANLSSYYGADTATLRMSSLTNDGSLATATFIAQEEKSADAETFHVMEDVSGIAFAQEGLLLL